MTVHARKKALLKDQKQNITGGVTNLLADSNPLNLLLHNPPFPSPVEPLVYIMTAMSSGLGPFRTKDAKRKRLKFPSNRIMKWNQDQ